MFRKGYAHSKISRVLLIALGSSTTTSTTTSASSTPTYYRIDPNPKQDISVLNAFTSRLKAETDPSTLWVVDVPNLNLIFFWKQKLTSAQVKEFSKDPAVSIESLNGCSI
jgi:hypothetical protein